MNQSEGVLLYSKSQSLESAENTERANGNSGTINHQNSANFEYKINADSIQGLDTQIP